MPEQGLYKSFGLIDSLHSSDEGRQAHVCETAKIKRQPGYRCFMLVIGTYQDRGTVQTATPLQQIGDMPVT
ncbi:hypothetical protein GCM10007159_40070 [Modicisalibacter luteus]|nr:hypothetical protein GCM10007159_40070 [Halomonas lutea]